jgi:hypothetical protein
MNLQLTPAALTAPDMKLLQRAYICGMILSSSDAGGALATWAPSTLPDCGTIIRHF